MNVHDGNTIVAETLYRGEMGRIVATPAQRTLDAWDWRGEHLGTFTSPSDAMEAMHEAKEIHAYLVEIYNSRKR